MKPSLLALAVLTLLDAAPLAAEKLSAEFRAAFEKVYRKEASHAVVMHGGIPTTSVYGPRKTYKTGYYDIEIEDGEWRRCPNPDEPDQMELGRLEKGEIVKLAGIAYKDNRINLRMVALEPREVTRNSLTRIKDQYEPVATNFRFFLPFDKSRVLTASDLPVVQKYIEAYLKFFPDQASAQSFAARVRPPSARAPGAPPASGQSAGGRATARRDIKPGMSPDQVRAVLGPPVKEVTFGQTARWTYPDASVLFENGRVKEVKY